MTSELDSKLLAYPDIGALRSITYLRGGKIVRDEGMGEKKKKKFAIRERISRESRFSDLLFSMNNSTKDFEIVVARFFRVDLTSSRR